MNIRIVSFIGLAVVLIGLVANDQLNKICSNDVAFYAESVYQVNDWLCGDDYVLINSDNKDVKVTAMTKLADGTYEVNEAVNYTLRPGESKKINGDEITGYKLSGDAETFKVKMKIVDDGKWLTLFDPDL